MANNSVGIASFRNKHYNMSDLELSWKEYNTQPTEVINIPSNQTSGNHAEAELDTQYITAMGPKIPMQFWFTSGINFPNALMEWAINVLNSNTQPLLFSVSWGSTEYYLGENFINRYNTELAAMGTAGISILFGSGDTGAGGECSNGTYNPEYPASSPYITSIGGVWGGNSSNTPIGETVYIDGGSGFSNYSPIQSYQKIAVENYLTNCSNNLPPLNMFNASGRAYPDISAQSVNFTIIIDGKQASADGTSCATPTVGGIFGLINDLRLQNGMKHLGFLNPFIYQLAQKNYNAFNDVIEGYNKGCSDTTKAFTACKGFDVASGWGSPNYEEIIDTALEWGKKTKKWVK